MKKQFTSYKLSHSHLSNGHMPLKARKDMAYEIKLAARLILDAAVYQWNKQHIESQIDEAIDNNDKTTFNQLSKQYASYVTHE